MPTPRDPDFVRRQLLAHFDAPPRLTFDQPGFTRLDYRQPELERSEKDRRAFNDDRPPPQGNALGQLQEIVRKSLERLDYADTKPEEWRAYVRFALDRVEHRRGGIALRPGKPQAQREFINDTCEDAHAWFLEELLPIIQSEKDAHVYLLGEPGAGKSTLLKYLINTNAEALQQTDTVLSRFEFQKFCDRWFSGNISRLRTDLSVYVSFLLLRDLIWFVGYGFDARGQRLRRWPLPALQRIVKQAFARHGLDSVKQINLVARQLNVAMGDHKLDLKRLKHIAPWAMTVLVDHLREGQKIALVIDGLDCVALEDSAFDAERHRLLQGILDLRPKLTQLSVPVVDTTDDDQVLASIDVEVPAKLIFVIRENTFFLHGDGLKRETPLVERHTFHVGNLDPEVALLNVVRRGGAIWSQEVGADPAAGEAYAQLMMHGLYTAFRHLNGALRTGERYRRLLLIFCGNLRHLFDFLARLIDWLIADAISEKLLKLAPGTDLDTVLAFLASDDGREVLRRRSYRLIEILLFYRLPWFETLVHTGLSDMAADFLMGSANRELKDNRYFTGFLDNIFNYHVQEHGPGDDHHPLLEKIRIIQLLKGRSLSPVKLTNALSGRLGYTSDNLMKTMRILVRGQLVRAEVVENDVLFTATTRGEIVVDHVARSMTYLEHVYHQTLFPTDFLPARADSPRRSGHVETWTAHSIRNCYVFLTYMRFVENNRAKDKRVPPTLRIYQQTLDQVRQSVVGIIGDPDKPTQDAELDARQIAIAREALGLVESILGYWEYRGYVAEIGAGGQAAKITVPTVP